MCGRRPVPVGRSGLVGATPKASVVTAGQGNGRRVLGCRGTIPGHLTCRYTSAWDAGSRADDGRTVSIQADVEEFAALLRRLKDRTDRSYASLARRVGMNTSTLHRYCAGEVVPQDFDPWSGSRPSAGRQRRNGSSCTGCGCPRRRLDSGYLRPVRPERRRRHRYRQRCHRHQPLPLPLPLTRTLPRNRVRNRPQPRTRRSWRWAAARSGSVTIPTRTSPPPCLFRAFDTATDGPWRRAPSPVRRSPPWASPSRCRRGVRPRGTPHAPRLRGRPPTAHRTARRSRRPPPNRRGPAGRPLRPRPMPLLRPTTRPRP